MKFKLYVAAVIAVALLAVPAIAPAAVSWTTGTITGTPSGNIVDVAWNKVQSPSGQFFVAITDGGTGSNDILTSTDGKSWSVSSSGVTGTWNAVEYGGLSNRFYVVGDADKAMVSADATATSWALMPVGTGNYEHVSCGSGCNWTALGVSQSETIWMFADNGKALWNFNGTQAFSEPSSGYMTNWPANNATSVVVSYPTYGGRDRLWAFGSVSGSPTAALQIYPNWANESSSAPFASGVGTVLAAAASWLNYYPAVSDFVIAGTGGVYTSTSGDSGSWSSASVPSLSFANPADIRGVAESNGRWMMVGAGGKTAETTSASLSSWSVSTAISGSPSPLGVVSSAKLCLFVAYSANAFWWANDGSTACSGGGSGGGGSGYTNLERPTTTLSGCTLTLSNGQWSPTPGAYTYTWYTANPGSFPEEIGNSQSYTFTAADAGKRVQGVVRVGDSSFSTSASAPVVTLPECTAGGSSSSTPSTGPDLRVSSVPKQITLDIVPSANGGTQEITAEVPCTAPEGQLLDRCTVNMTAPASVMLGQGDGINVRAGKTVSIGRATVRATSGKRVIVVKVKVNQRGRKALRRNTKIRATIGLSAITVSNESSTGSTTSELRLPTQLISPQRGIFNSNSTTLNKAGIAFVKRLAKLLPAKPKRMVFIGFADNTGVPGDNRWLGDRRAKAVRDALAARGIEPVKSSIETKAARSPRDDNATAKGRERNRRVSIRITY